MCDHCFSLLSLLISFTFGEAGLVITTPQGTLVSPTSSQSFVSGHPATTMIVSALHSQGKTLIMTHCTVRYNISQTDILLSKISFN